jgi:hypothetical protein
MRRLALVLLPAALAAPAPALADDRVIAPGVTAAGAPLGGLTVDQAALALQVFVAPKATAPVTVRSAGRTFTLTARRAGVRFDPVRTAERAYRAGQAGPAPADVPLALRVDARAARAFAEGVDRRVSRAPRDATLRIAVTRMHVRPSRAGRTIDEHVLGLRIVRALREPLARRRALRAPTYPDRADVTVATLRRRTPVVLTVDRRTRHLRLFEGLRHRRTYRVAVGAAGFDTPAGLFSIQSRQVDPAWTAPDRPWAGALAGRTIPGGAPGNPLRARWLGVNGAVGIHGTAEEWSIGGRASHGCIRMRVRDVVELYPRVPLGAPVLIR